MERGEQSSEEEQQLPMGCVYPFLAILWIVGLALTVEYVGLVVRSVRLLGYRETPAWIEDAEIVDHSDGDGRNERLRIAFRYEVDGRSHRSETATVRQRSLLFASDGFVTSSAAHLATARAALRSGATLPCLVDPRDPTRAYLFHLRPKDWLEPTILWLLFGVLPLAGPAAWLRRAIPAFIRRRRPPR